MWIHETAFNSISQLRHVAARRPQTRVTPTNPVPAATPFQLQITDGPVGGSGVIALSLGSYRREVAVALIEEQTVFWADSLLLPIYLGTVSFDSTGATQLPLFNPGFGNPLVLTVQCFLLDRAKVSAGSSEPRLLTLR